ncbi:MAG: helix-turn-helix transcriptional regulator, partial [Pseudomonadota bacterium]|nr:helix-turn-helix transcriptional regulator [Pseudomonadota bacterium]
IYAESLTEYGALFDLLPFSVYWKNTAGIYLGRNQFAAEQMVILGLEQTLNINYVICKTDFELFDFKTANQYRKNELITLTDPTTTHHFIETLRLPSEDVIDHISIKRCILDKNAQIIGTLSSTININKFIAPEISFQDLVKETALNRLHKLILTFMASKNGLQYDEICEILLYLINLYPQEHQLRKLLLLTTREQQCLCLLLKGYSSKQIGAVLMLSYRTIEIHIDNVKQKLHIPYKVEIADWFWDLLSQL